MKKLCLFITLLLVLPFIVKAQNQVKGTVKDDTGQAVIAANVFVLSPKDSTVLKGTKTDLSGHYDLKGIPGGKFILSVSMIGFKKSYTKIDLQSPILNVPSIVLQRDSKVLDQVVIKAKKPLFEQKLDRTIINVQSSIASSGGTALEVLEKAPGVVVDRQNNSISMNGKDGVVVMINGKINHMPLSAVVQMLAGMNSSNIQTIELITNPPANFDAEGNAGYINIKLKNNPNAGTNGSYTLTAGYGNGFSPDGSLNFNHRNNKINFYGDYSFSTTPLDQQFNLYRKVSRETSVIENLTQSQRQATDRNHNGKLGLDFQLDSNTVIGALVSGYDNKWSMDAVNSNSIMINNAVDTSINIANDEINQWKHLMGNVNFQHTFLGASKAKITADIDYLYYRDNNPNNYINSYFNKTGGFLYDQKTKSDKVTPIKVWVAKTDYTRKLGKSIDLESGLKSTISRFNNDVSINRFVQDVWNYDPSLSNSYDLKENISAIYTSLSYGINEKTSVKVGFRYEYTVSNLNSATQKNIVDRQYGTLFPSIFISRKLNADQSINLAYNKRITRPTFNDMAPFVIFMDPNTFFSGNSGLQPAISNSVKASYLVKRTIFSISYNHEDNAISRFQPKINAQTNKQTYAADNLDYIKTVSTSFSIPAEITSWWNMQNTAIANWNKVKGFYQGQSMSISQKYVRLTTSQNFTLPKDFSFEISGFFISPSLFGMSRTQAFGSLNMGAQKKFNKNNSTLRFNVNDVLKTMKIKSSIDAPEFNLITDFQARFSPSAFSVSFTQNFGNKSLGERKSRATGSEEERSRVSP